MPVHANKELAVRLETIEALNQVGYAIAFNKLPRDFDAAYKKIGTGYAVYAGNDSPLTQAFAFGLGGPVEENEILELEEFFGQRGSAVNIEVCNLSDISLAQTLISRGYRVIEYSNLLVKSLKDENPEDFQPELFIRRVKPDEIDRFSASVAKGFIDEGHAPDALLDVFKVWFTQANCTCFGAFIDNEPLGGGAVFIRDGVAEFGGASTLHRYRNRGIQTALLKARICHAMMNGCDLAMVTTLPGTISQRNVERQGFQIAYTRTKFTNQK